MLHQLAVFRRDQPVDLRTGKRTRNFRSSGMACTTLPSADGLTNRMREKSCELNGSDFKQAGAVFLKNKTLASSIGAANSPKIAFIVAEKRCRRCSRRATSSLVTQLNWITRRLAEKGLWPCHELSLRLNARSVSSIGGTSRIMSSRSRPDLSSRNWPPAFSQFGFMAST